jgi:uncharacterized membrane protein
MKAKLFSLNTKDFFKGLIVAVLTAIGTFLVNELQAGSVIDLTLLKRIGIAALIAFIAYIVKNLLTNSKDEFITPEK